MGKRIVSFSLWGENSLYIDGAVKNAKLYPEIFTGWSCRFYHDDSVSADVLSQLADLGAELVLEPRLPDVLGMFWRFKPMDELDIERFLVRDTDSLPNVRELRAVEEWIDSGKAFHIMRDCESHATSILGGTWGAVPGCVDRMVIRIGAWFSQIKPSCDNPRGRFHGSDQQFLHSVVWPIIFENQLAHIRGGMEHLRLSPTDREFPTEFDKEEGYVGQVK